MSGSNKQSTPKKKRFVPTEETYAFRLLRLAEYLRSVPDEQWDYSVWYSKVEYTSSPNVCGTTACALGHACMMPEFRKLGARLRSCENGYAFPVLVKNRKKARIGEFVVCWELFNLSANEVNELFINEKFMNDPCMADSRKGRLAVADNIVAFCKNKYGPSVGLDYERYKARNELERFGL